MTDKQRMAWVGSGTGWATEAFRVDGKQTEALAEAMALCRATGSKWTGRR
jgi:hypothetical protein